MLKYDSIKHMLPGTLPIMGPLIMTKLTKKIRINRCKTLILDILTQSLHLFPISENILGELQFPYSKLQRRIAIATYNADNRTTNFDIRRKTKTRTLKSLLYVRYMKQIPKCQNNMSFAYLNNMAQINDDFKSFDININNFLEHLISDETNARNCNSHASCNIRDRLIL